MLVINGKRDDRHVVHIEDSYTYASATVINKDGTYECVTYMTDDMRTWNNTATIDATSDELETYRKRCKQFRVGDVVEIVGGRKMRGEQKTVARMFRYNVEGTYGHRYTDYLVFTDGTKVNELHCIIL